MRFLIPLFLASALIPAAESMMLSLRGDDWPPYNTDPKAEKPGFLIEIAKAVFEPKGYTIDYQLSSWVRAVKDAREGTIDVLVGVGSSETEGLLLTKTAQGFSDNHFYTLPESTWSYADPSSLSAITLGAVKDYTYTPAVDARIATKDRVMEVAGDRPLHQLIKLLEAKRVDVLVENQMVMNWTLQALNKQQALRDAGSAQVRDAIYLGFSAKRPGATKRLAVLEAGMVEMAADGRLAAIYARYGVSVEP
jgi:polar amino acid transport system substrate-binding protein